MKIFDMKSIIFSCIFGTNLTFNNVGNMIFCFFVYFLFSTDINIKFFSSLYILYFYTIFFIIYFFDTNVLCIYMFQIFHIFFCYYTIYFSIHCSACFYKNIVIFVIRSCCETIIFVHAMVV